MLLAASLATIGAVAYLGVGFVHLRELFDNRSAELAPVAPQAVESAAMQPAPAPVITAANNDSAALNDMRSELAAIRKGNA